MIEVEYDDIRVGDLIYIILHGKVWARLLVQDSDTVGLNFGAIRFFVEACEVGSDSVHETTYIFDAADNVRLRRADRRNTYTSADLIGD